MVEANTGKKIKRFVFKMVCRILYYSGLYFILKSIFQKNGLYILFYHNIVDSEKCMQTGEPIPSNSVDKKSLEYQLKYYKKEFTLITIDEAYDLLKENKKFDKRYLVVTFDDGYKDNYAHGYDLFLKYQVYPTIYLTANNVDKGTYLWPDILKSLVFNSRKVHINLDIYDIHYACSLETRQDRMKFLQSITEDIKKLDEEKKHEVFECLSKALGAEIINTCDIMLNWNEVMSLSNIGVIFGAHTMNHPILANLTENDADYEICGSKALIEERTKKKIEHFAYPNGKAQDINDRCVNLVQKCYKTAVTTIPGVNKPETDLMRLKRIGLSYDLGIIDLKVKILYCCIMDKLKSKKQN